MNHYPFMTPIQSITGKLKKFTAAITAAQKGSGVPQAEQALHDAIAAKDALTVEDESISPLELVQRRGAAAQAVEVCEIELARAQRRQEAAAMNPWSILAAAKVECAAALRKAGECHGDKLKAEIAAVVGERDFAADAGRYEALAFRQSDEFFQLARLVEAVEDPESASTLFAQAFDLIEKGNR